MTPLQITRSVRSLNRLRQIARVLTQHGFGHVVDRLNLKRYVSVLSFRPRRRPRIEEPTESNWQAIGRRLTRVCSDLGPTFVKLGQTLTTRPDLIPDEIIQELRSLQDRVAPFDTQLAHQLIEKELGAPLSECYARIGDTPLASGSIGQVYRATTRDGMDVVVKVKRPDIDHMIELDMHILMWIADGAERLIPESHAYRPVQLVQEFSDTLRRELDFTSEASATARIGDALADNPYVRIPKVRWDLSGPRVLTLEVLKGENLETAIESTDARIDRKAIAKRLAEAYLKQFFEVGVFHADPHPGNILVSPPAAIGLIDFGQVGVMSDEQSTLFLLLILAVVNRDPELIVEILDDLNSLGSETDRDQLSRSIRMLLIKYHGLPIRRLDLHDVFHEATQAIRENDVTVPSNVIVLIKALTTVTGVAMRLDPELNLVSLLKPRIKSMIADRLSPAKVIKTAGLAAWQIWGVRAAPSQVKQILRQLARGEWEVKVRHENVERLTTELDRSSNRLAMSIVVAAVIVGSSMVVGTSGDLPPFGIPLCVLGIVGYLIAGVLGLALVWAILRSGRLH